MFPIISKVIKAEVVTTYKRLAPNEVEPIVIWVRYDDLVHYDCFH